MAIFCNWLLNIKEAWESPCYSSHPPRLWHRPNSQNEQRRSPRRYVYKHTFLLEANNGCQHNRCRILHTYGRHCCFDSSTVSLELPDSERSSTKRQVTPILYIGLHLRQTHPQAGLRYEDTAKITSFSEPNKLLREFLEKCVFHKACGASMT